MYSRDQNIQMMHLVKLKLEAAKRRLHKGYQQVQNGLSSVVALYLLFKFIRAILLNYEVDFISITCFFFLSKSNLLTVKNYVQQAIAITLPRVVACLTGKTRDEHCPRGGKPV